MGKNQNSANSATTATATANSATSATTTAVLARQDERHLTQYGKVSFSASSLGYESSELEFGANGGLMVKLKDENGATIEKEVFMEDKSAFDAVNAYARLRDGSKIGDVAKCYFIAKTAPLAKASGFNSVGAFLALQFGLDASTANNYALIGSDFLTLSPVLDDNGNEQFDDDGNRLEEVNWIKPDIMRGWTASNLNQCISLYRKACECDIDKFLKEYVFNGRLHLDAKQAVLKAEYNKVCGKADSKSSKASTTNDSKPESPKESVRSLWAKVKENILAYDLSDNEVELFKSSAESIEKILEAHDKNKK